MTIHRSTAYRDAKANVDVSQIGPSAQVQVRSGVNATTGGQGTLLAQLTGDATAWGTVSNGVVTVNAITEDSSADATGTAGHYQINTSAGVFVESGLLDGTDGLTIDNANITAGQVVRINGPWTRTEFGA